jgi:hypothetical protein
MPLQDRAISPVPCHLKRHPIIRTEASGEQRYLLRLGLDPTRGANLTILDDRDLTEIQMNVQPDRSHHNLLALGSKARETRWANDTDVFAPEAQPDKSQGRPLKVRAQTAPIVQRSACPTCVLPESPGGRFRPDAPESTRTSTENSPQGRQPYSRTLDTFASTPIVRPAAFADASNACADLSVATVCRANGVTAGVLTIPGATS